MPPRKSVPGADKDDAAAAANAVGGGSTTTGGATGGKRGRSQQQQQPQQQQSAAGDAGGALVYTAEEVAFLQAQANLCGGDYKELLARGSGEAWRTRTLPTLAAITRKALRLAQDNYSAKPHTVAGATGGGGGGGGSSGGKAGAAAGTSKSGKHNGGGGSPQPSQSVLSASGDQGAAGGGGGSPTAEAQGPAAGTTAEFAEENQYLLEQLQAMPWMPFTYQRLVEVLLGAADAAPAGRIKGEALQAAIRRCVLVSYGPVGSNTDL